MNISRFALRAHNAINIVIILYFYLTIVVFRCSVADVIAMGCFGSKDKLSKEDMDFLKSHTRYDEATIKEWYKGFKVSK